MANNSFSSGLTAGAVVSGAIDRREELAQRARSNQQQQQELMRKQVVDGVESAIKQTADLVKEMTPVIATAEGEQKVAAMTTLKQGRSAIFDSTNQMLNKAVENGFVTVDEARTISQRAALAGKYIDPAAAQQLAAEGEGAVAGAKAGAELPSELEKIQERGRQARLTKQTQSGKETIVTGAPVDFLTDTQKGKLQTQRIASETALTQSVFAINELLKIVESPEFIGGNTGDLVSAVNSMVAQVQAVSGAKPVVESSVFENGRNLDLDQVSEGITDKNLSLLRKWAVSDDMEESASLNLAFILAKSLNNSGKITDADVENAKKIIGTSADPASRRAVLRSLQERMIRNYNIEQEIMSRNLPGMGFDPLTMDSIMGTEGVDTESTQGAMEELKRLEEENRKLEEELRVGQ